MIMEKEIMVNSMMFDSFCGNDETRIFEAIASLCKINGMPDENVPSFVMELIGVINRWSDMIHQG